MSSSASKKPGVVHDTVVVERRFPVAVATVFAAFADAEQRARWHFPGEDWELVEFEQDFRVGGREHSRFGPKGEANLREEGLFLDIVENTRIVSCGTMHQDDLRISVTLCTVEFDSDGDGTRLKLTDQSAFLDGRERPDERRAGWGKVLRRLESFLTSSRPKA
jgi:uncharacterized protein YndB with AHSA1/START domain